MKEKTFSDYTKEARAKFTNYISSLEWNVKLRTECEDLLIAFDQMKAKCDSKNSISWSNFFIGLIAGIFGTIIIIANI